jgi:hypothetical protein
VRETLGPSSGRCERQTCRPARAAVPDVPVLDAGAVECRNGPPVAARQRACTAVVAQAVRRKRRGLLSAKLALPGPQRGQALSRCTSWLLRDAWFFSLLIIAFSTSSRFIAPRSP